ncbi:MAG: molybdenum cofactor guanylyltransferase, partial [Planctomycetota bacterium]
LLTALAAVKTDYLLAIAGDLPFASPDIAKLLLSKCKGFDVTVPMLEEMYEPLFAVYSKNCLAAFEKGLEEGRKKIIDLFDTCNTNGIPESAWRPLDPDGNAFMNINTPNDLNKL